jgi:hypothetical protein
MLWEPKISRFWMRSLQLLRELEVSVRVQLCYCQLGKACDLTLIIFEPCVSWSFLSPFRLAGFTNISVLRAAFSLMVSWRDNIRDTAAIFWKVGEHTQFCPVSLGKEIELHLSVCLTHTHIHICNVRWCKLPLLMYGSRGTGDYQLQKTNTAPWRGWTQ